jgi:hypothetical protein
MRHYGLQPMTIINPGDPLPEPTAVIMLRWEWRSAPNSHPLSAP